MPNKRSIIFINQYSGYLTVDIIRAFQDQFEDISLITGILNQRNHQLPEGIRVSKIISPKRNNSFQRITTWTIGFIQIIWKVFWRSSKVYLFIVSNPPFATLLPLFCRNKYTLVLFDIYPDLLIENKILPSKSIIVRLWGKANKSIFKRAEKIFTITEGMKSRVAQYVSADNISVVPIWTDNDFFRTIPRDKNIFIQQNKLENKFIIMYSGNLGFTHNIEILVDLAHALKDLNIVVLIIGEGAKKTLIKRKIKTMGVNNCKFLPLQPVDMLPYSFSAAHIGVVSLGTGASSLSLPSKTFNLMSVGVPLLCIAAHDSELANIVRRYNLGGYFTTDDLDGMISFVIEMYKDKIKYRKLSDNSKVASLDFSPKNAKMYLN